MNLAQKVGHLITVGIPGYSVTEETAAFIRECHPACVALFGNNLAGPWATARLIANLQKVAAEAGDAPLLIGIDQEGGQVAHLRYPCVEMPSQMGLAAAGGPPVVGAVSEILGREMGRLGLNLAFAPVLDVNTNQANPVIGTRAFSDNAELVASCGLASIQGLHRAGTLSMAKHFPGHGATSSDSHLGLPVVERSREEMWAVDLLPFKVAIEAGVDSLCTAHVVYPGLDDSGLPATLSHRINTGLLRQKLNFEGVLFTDALIMDAISRKGNASIAAAAIKAVLAGADCVMLLGSLAQQRLTFGALLAAAQDGTIPDRRLNEAVTRVQTLRGKATLHASTILPAWPEMNHHGVAAQVAQAAVTLVRDTAGLLPLRGKCIGVIEFIAGTASPVEGTRNEPLGTSTLALLLGQRFRDIKFLTLSSGEAGSVEVLDTFIEECDSLVVTTRSAILDPNQMMLLGRLAGRGDNVIHLALRNPYDTAREPGISTVLLTYSDHPASITAVVGALCGDYSPTGQLPVHLKNLR